MPRSGKRPLRSHGWSAHRAELGNAPSMNTAMAKNRAHSTEFSGEKRSQVYYVTGVTGENCALAISDAVKNVRGISRVETSIVVAGISTVTVAGPGASDTVAMQSAINDAGCQMLASARHGGSDTAELGDAPAIRRAGRLS